MLTISPDLESPSKDETSCDQSHDLLRVKLGGRRAPRPGVRSKVRRPKGPRLADEPLRCLVKSEDGPILVRPVRSHAGAVDRPSTNDCMADDHVGEAETKSAGKAISASWLIMKQTPLSEPFTRGVCGDKTGATAKRSNGPRRRSSCADVASLY